MTDLAWGIIILGIFGTLTLSLLGALLTASAAGGKRRH